MADRFAPFAATIYPPIYRRVAHLSYAAGFVLTGVVEVVQGVATLAVADLAPLELSV